MFEIDDTETNPDIASARQDGDTLVVQMVGTDPEGRTQYRYEVWIAGTLVEQGDDLHTGVHMDAGPVRMLATLAGFLGAAAESYAFSMRTGQRGENYDLFTPPVVEWAHQNSDELAMFASEIENEEE